MKWRKDYPGIDIFRMIAAILVIGIHTWPFADFGEIPELLFTRTIARIAVPFFFMASGFFLFGKGDEKGRSGFLKKTSILYGVSILLYLPVNIYSGYFKEPSLFYNIIKDLIFDGTFYHLWYLPASILGMGMVFLMVSGLGMKGGLWISLILYCIGLFGDSYYGWIEQVGFIKKIYDGIFVITDYTRNGLFFVPIFFLTGGMIARQKWKWQRNKCMFFFFLFLACMIGESLLLHQWEIPKFDSMYIFLLPCMIFLFQWLIVIRGKSRRSFRLLSMLVYLIHPMIIILVRGGAKVTKLEKVLVENHLIHFFVVTIVSLGVSIGIEKIFSLKGVKNNDNPLWKHGESLGRN